MKLSFPVRKITTKYTYLYPCKKHDSDIPPNQSVASHKNACLVFARIYLFYSLYKMAVPQPGPESGRNVTYELSINRKTSNADFVTSKL